ncbi:nickel-responsive transcriptional regulator NikR [Methanocella conradii]|uniref:nickel-responsive transcriptional regulator NikR n=1 Tax=Methanocella conradii TaxID=1175444 RepID=UPI00157C4881|nr:nickel-responsive transcriptional regulator NikR [Methanocella conradii]
MGQGLMRIGVSLPDNLLSRFDEIIGSWGYSSRSEAIRDAIRNYIQYYDWMNEVEGERIGVISIVYDQDKKGLLDSLMQIQNEYCKLMLSAFHVYLDRESCMEIMTFKGNGKDIKGAAEKMMALKGVKHVKLTTIALDTIT